MFETPVVCPNNRRILILLTAWVTPIIRADRPLAKIFLRAITFQALGLRHICCSFPNVDNYTEWPEYGAWPDIPDRYDELRVQEIIEEDSFLRERLEILVDKFEADYETRQEDMAEFVVGHWTSCMLKEMEEIAVQDHETYHHGRTQLGVSRLSTNDQLFDVSGTCLARGSDRQEEMYLSMGRRDLFNYLSFLG